MRTLAAVGDDAMVKDLARRLNQPESQGADLIGRLVEQMHRNTAGEFVERLQPVRELDYARHGIKLLLSSRASAMRLRSVEKEPFCVEWIERSIKPGDVFYDVGANVGAYSLISAKATGNRARVFAFEPSASTFHDLSRNVLLNDCAGSVVPLPLALWSESGPLSLSFRSLRAGAARHRITAGHRPDAPLTVTILGLRLDDLVEHFGIPVPTHAKIDVDGSELEVLRGAENTLGRPEWRSIILELDSEDTERNHAVTSLLSDHGFGSVRRHAHRASRRYPRPEERPVAYWSFGREAS